MRGGTCVGVGGRGGTWACVGVCVCAYTWGWQVAQCISAVIQLIPPPPPDPPTPVPCRRT